MAKQGKELPGYVQREFEEFLKCGRLEHGFFRLRCDSCHTERLVAFSCKRRGQRKLKPSPVSLQRLVQHARRLYEQGGSKDRLWEYVTRWHRWLHGELSGIVNRKGGSNRYYDLHLKATGHSLSH